RRKRYHDNGGFPACDEARPACAGRASFTATSADAEDLAEDPRQHLPEELDQLLQRCQLGVAVTVTVDGDGGGGVRLHVVGVLRVAQSVQHRQHEHVVTIRYHSVAAVVVPRAVPGVGDEHVGATTGTTDVVGVHVV